MKKHFIVFLCLPVLALCYDYSVVTTNLSQSIRFTDKEDFIISLEEHPRKIRSQPLHQNNCYPDYDIEEELHDLDSTWPDYDLEDQFQKPVNITSLGWLYLPTCNDTVTDEPHSRPVRQVDIQEEEVDIEAYDYHKWKVEYDQQVQKYLETKDLRRSKKKIYDSFRPCDSAVLSASICVVWDILKFDYTWRLWRNIQITFWEGVFLYLIFLCVLGYLPCLQCLNPNYLSNKITSRITQLKPGSITGPDGTKFEYNPTEKEMKMFRKLTDRLQDL